MRHKKCGWDTWEVMLTPQQFRFWQAKHMLWINVLCTENEAVDFVVMYARRWYFVHHDRVQNKFHVRRARYKEWFKWSEVCMRPGVDAGKIYFDSKVKSGMSIESIGGLV